jgi:glucose-6-phosphate 1-dehydrogenase
MTPRMSYPPIALILFGASGDLVWRKLAPALFDLYGDGWLPERWMVLGVGRSPLDDGSFRARLLDGVRRFARHRPDEPSGAASLTGSSTSRGITRTPPSTRRCASGSRPWAMRW